TLAEGSEATASLKVARALGAASCRANAPNDQSSESPRLTPLRTPAHLAPLVARLPATPSILVRTLHLWPVPPSAPTRRRPSASPLAPWTCPLFLCRSRKGGLRREAAETPLPTRARRDAGLRAAAGRGCCSAPKANG